MPLPPAALDPARLPGRTVGAIVDAGIARPRRFAALLLILIAIAAVPVMLIVALARIWGDR